MGAGGWRRGGLEEAGWVGWGVGTSGISADGAAGGSLFTPTLALNLSLSLSLHLRFGL